MVFCKNQPNILPVDDLAPNTNMSSGVGDLSEVQNYHYQIA